MAADKDWSGPYRIDDLTVHRDQRGVLYEALRFSTQEVPTGGQIYVYSIVPGMRRGDHFHERKSEWFFCVAGSVRLLMRTPDGKEIDEVLSADAPRLVHAGPGTSHAVVNEGPEPAVIVAYASKEFDPADPDTVPVTVCREQ